MRRSAAARAADTSARIPDCRLQIHGERVVAAWEERGLLLAHLLRFRVLLRRLAPALLLRFLLVLPCWFLRHSIPPLRLLMMHHRRRKNLLSNPILRRPYVSPDFIYCCGGGGAPDAGDGGGGPPPSGAFTVEFNAFTSFAFSSMSVCCSPCGLSWMPSFCATCICPSGGRSLKFVLIDSDTDFICGCCCICACFINAASACLCSS